jgi:hypothetical protein
VLRLVAGILNAGAPRGGVRKRRPRATDVEILSHCGSDQTSLELLVTYALA